MSRIIGVVSGKGGVGKTTVALNLGAALSHHFRKSVTLIDCNLTAPHAALHLGIHNLPATLNKVLKDELPAAEAAYHHFSGMKIIPASLSIKDLTGVDVHKIGHVVRNIAHQNDVIILDGSPGFGREAMSVMRPSDELLFVTTPHIPAVMDVVRFKELASLVNAKPLGVVANMVGRDKYEMKAGEIEYLTEMPVISSIPYDSHVSRSLARRVPFSVVHPKARASRAVMGLAAHLIGETYRADSSLIDAIKSVFRR